MERIRCIVAVVALSLLSAVTAEGGEVYVCTDSSGAVQYTNVPMNASCTVFSKKRRQRVAAPANALKNRWRLRRGAMSSYDPHIWAVANRYRIDPYLIKAVIRTESDFDHRAVSRSGAQGLMQLMPETARLLRVRNPFDPKQNIDGGARYLRYLLDTFNGDLILSLAAYNAGPGAVRRANGVPKLPETVRYVVKVLQFYKGYKNGSRT